jgi:hypothetical protein
MPKQRHQISSDLTNTIAAYIGGAFPEVAAEAAGIPTATFRRWMKLAAMKRAQPVYRTFDAASNLAGAQARVLAEMEVHEEDPKSWLTRGPGKDTPLMPE